MGELGWAGDVSAGIDMGCRSAQEFVGGDAAVGGIDAGFGEIESTEIGHTADGNKYGFGGEFCGAGGRLDG